MKQTEEIYNLLINKHKKKELKRKLGNYLLFLYKKLLSRFNYRGGLCLSLRSADDTGRKLNISLRPCRGAGLFFHFSRSLGVFVCYN